MGWTVRRSGLQFVHFGGLQESCRTTGVGSSLSGLPFEPNHQTTTAVYVVILYFLQILSLTTLYEGAIAYVDASSDSLQVILILQGHLQV